MKYNNIIKDINTNSLKNVYLCYGNESYLKDSIISKIKKKYIDEVYETLNYHYFDDKNTSANDIVNACETLPFMADKKIVVIEDSLYICGANNKKEEENILNKYLLNSNNTTCLIFFINSDKIDRRKKIVKTIKKVGLIIHLEKVMNEKLDKWVIKTFKKYKKNISKSNIYYFLESTGYLEKNSDKTLYDLENEIIKIVNYLGNQIQVKRKHIDNVLIRSLQNNIFKLVDNIGKKDTQQSLEIFNQMLLKNEPIQLIFHMIIRQFRLLYKTKIFYEKGYNNSQIARKIGLHSFVVKKIIKQSRKFSKDELKKGLEKCLETDRSIKTGEMDAKLSVELLIVETTVNY